MRIAFIVQRCGEDIIGGAESYCLNLAKNLSKFFDVEILTTCAKDYMTWKNQYPPNTIKIDNVILRRFEVDFERNVKEFNQLSAQILNKPHSNEDEILWLKKQGPFSSNLINFLKENKNDYDIFIFVTYLYGTTFFGISHVYDKSILIPAADDDLSLTLHAYDQLFKSTQGIIFQTEEERSLLLDRFEINNIPNKIINQGVNPPVEIPQGFILQNITDFPYLFYLGRIDESKGCVELIKYFKKFKQNHNSNLKLVLAGPKIFDYKEDDDIVYVGIVSEIEKSFLLKNSKIFVMPSPHESFSMVIMESWMHKKPVLVNALSKVLRGHCEKSNGGLFYENYDEFSKCLELLQSDTKICNILGQNGQKYVHDNYTWERMINELKDFILLVIKNIQSK